RCNSRWLLRRDTHIFFFGLALREAILRTRRVYFRTFCFQKAYARCVLGQVEETHSFGGVFWPSKETFIARNRFLQSKDVFRVPPRFLHERNPRPADDCNSHGGPHPLPTRIGECGGQGKGVGNCKNSYPPPRKLHHKQLW